MTSANRNGLGGILDRLKSEPDSFEANVELAVFHYGRDELPEAVERLRKAAVLRPDNAALLLFLGVLLRLDGRVAESGACLEKALEIDGDDFDVLYQYGQHLYLEGNHSRAADYMRRALGLRPDDPEVLNDLGVVHFLAGDIDRAVKRLRQAVELRPDGVQVRVNLGYTLLAAKDLDAARAELEALSGRPEPEVRGLREAVEKGVFSTGSPASSQVLGLAGSIGRIDPMSMVKDFGEGAGGREPHVSVVVPVFNEAGNVPPLHEELDEVLTGLGVESEIIYVDDGSTDGTREILEGLAEADKRVRVIQFRRNYGQTAALSAGFKYCSGEIVITLDGDMQNDPHDIPMLLDKMAEGYDLVNGWRKDRKDKALTRRFPSWAANRLINKLIEGTGVQLRDFGCTLKAYKKGIVKNIHLYGEMHRFIPVFAAWLGVNVAEIQVNHRPRRSGEAKYGLSRVWRVIFDLIVVRFFSDYMTRPIQFFGKIARKATGFGLGAIAVLWGLKSFVGLDVSYDALFILLALVLISGLQVVILGLTGELLIRSYFEGQDKDHYVVRRIVGD